MAKRFEFGDRYEIRICGIAYLSPICGVICRTCTGAGGFTFRSAARYTKINIVLAVQAGVEPATVARICQMRARRAVV